MENQSQLNAERMELLGKLKQAMPSFTEAEYAVIGLTYKDGALSSKIKRLISLAVALKVGCTNCILAQTQYALDQGATREEILETLQVLISMGGTTGIAESLRVVKYLDELGVL